MAITTLDPVNIILANVYLVMILQLALNWSDSDCGTKSYLFQLAFIGLMVIRLIIQQLYSNKIMTKKPFAFFMFFISGVLLLALGIFQSYNISKNSSDFYYNADTKEGNETCFQNRIVFVGQIIIGFLTLLKDVYFIIFAKNEEVVSSE